MSVVNCSVKNIRPKYKNLKEWMNDPNNVYIGPANRVLIDGERFPKYASPFNNPFKIGKHGDRNEVMKKYRKYMYKKLEESSGLLVQFVELKGKNLGCFCKPHCCHGDIILELLYNYT